MIRYAVTVAGLLIIAGIVMFSRTSDQSDVEVSKGRDQESEAENSTSHQKLDTVPGSAGVLAVTEQEVRIYSEIRGRVVYMSAELVPGAGVSSGHILVRVDDRDYRLALHRALSYRDRTRQEFERLKRHIMAEHEQWKRYQTRRYFDPDPLVVYEPLLSEAKYALESALAAVYQAEINLDRTVVRSPAACKVVSVHTGQGIYVMPGEVLAVMRCPAK